MTLHVAEAGPDEGPLVILLHGCPEFWFGWRYQVGALAEAGYHVVIPDQRGYNPTDKPKGIAAYDVDKLADDVVALATHYTNEPFSLVGHDWGAVSAWWTATRAPQKVRRLAVLNCPHPAIWRDAMDHDPVQRRASWYVRAFRFHICRKRCCERKFSQRAQRHSRSKAAISEEEAERYRKAWRQPGALTAMINWYRAILRDRSSESRPETLANAGPDHLGTQRSLRPACASRSEQGPVRERDADLSARGDALGRTR